MKRLLPFAALLLWINACSDFHFVGVSHGSLPPDLVEPDTIRIPADSIVVQRLYSTNDTLFQADAIIRKDAYVAVPFQLKDTAQTLDSLFLYGSILSDDSLAVYLQHSGVLEPVANVQMDTIGGVVEHRIRMAVVPGVEYELRWENRAGENFSMGALLLVGYESADSSSLGVVSLVREYRETILVEQRDSIVIEPGMFQWLPLPMDAGDSLLAVVRGPGSLQWLLLDAADLDALLVSGETPANPLARGTAGSPLRSSQETSADPYFVIANGGEQEESYSDSVVIFRTLLDPL